MYLKKIVCENMGPISYVDIEPGFTEEGNPKPLILVGKNGTGKSILISNIVDSFFEFGDQAYSDITNKVNLGHSYFKVASAAQIKNNSKNMYCHLFFEGDENKSSVPLEYLYYMLREDTGEDDAEKTKEYLESILAESENKFKQHCMSQLTEKKLLKKEFFENAIAYFPPDRYTVPYWQGETYARTNDYVGMTIKESFQEILNKPIIVLNDSKQNLEWILDVVVDAKAELLFSDDNIVQSIPILGNIRDIKALDNAKKNIEQILSEICEKKVILKLKYRNFGNSRLSICEEATNNVVVSSLNALSTGQALLLDMFATIIRYGEKKDINNSIRLNQITGIVVIDEIEMHLHSDLQRKILPRLINLFPKVQFVITSHSPLFLLGMQEVFSNTGFDVYEMPNGERIEAESFSEFGKAYEVITQTKTYQQELKQLIQTHITQNEKALIITEGMTDWKHMKRAWNILKNSPEYVCLTDKFEFLEYEDNNSSSSSCIKLNMGCDNLLNMCRAFASLKNARTIIFIADRDVENIVKMLSGPDKFKNHGNNIFSFAIPVPDFRKTTPAICIEHYYSDEEICTEWFDVNTKRRLFMKKEFNESGFGIGKASGYFCKKINGQGMTSISILDGSKEKKVTSIENNGVGENFALSKNEFINAILNNRDGFKDIDSCNFKLIFDIIKDILILQQAAEPLNTEQNKQGEENADRN